MEEYNETNDNQNQTESAKENTASCESMCSSNPHGHIKIKMCAVCALAAFLGSFTAMYFIADKILFAKYRYPKFNPPFEDKLPDYFFDRDFRNIEKMFDSNDLRPNHRKHFLNFNAFNTSPVKLKTEYDDDGCKIIVGLQPFQNNPDNINFSASDQKITVFGKSDSSKKNVNTHVSFSQDFILPDNADINGITKLQKGNKLVISIPFNK